MVIVMQPRKKIKMVPKKDIAKKTVTALIDPEMQNQKRQKAFSRMMEIFLLGGGLYNNQQNFVEAEINAYKRIKHQLINTYTQLDSVEKIEALIQLNNQNKIKCLETYNFLNVEKVKELIKLYDQYKEYESIFIAKTKIAFKNHWSAILLAYDDNALSYAENLIAEQYANELNVKPDSISVKAINPIFNLVEENGKIFLHIACEEYEIYVNGQLHQKLKAFNEIVYELINDHTTKQLGYQVVSGETDTEFLRLLNKEKLIATDNQWLNTVAKTNFFEPGAHQDATQLVKDAKRSNFIYQGKPLVNHPDELSGEQVALEKLKQIFCPMPNMTLDETVKAIAFGATQTAGALISTSLMVWSQSNNYFVDVPDQKINTFQDEKTNKIYLEVTGSFFKITSISEGVTQAGTVIDQSMIAGSFHAPYRVRYELKQGKNEKGKFVWGYDLVFAETENQMIADMLQGVMPDIAQFEKDYIDPPERAFEVSAVLLEEKIKLSPSEDPAAKSITDSLKKLKKSMKDDQVPDKEKRKYNRLCEFLYKIWGKINSAAQLNAALGYMDQHKFDPEHTSLIHNLLLTSGIRLFESTIRKTKSDLVKNIGNYFSSENFKEIVSSENERVLIELLGVMSNLISHPTSPLYKEQFYDLIRDNRNSFSDELKKHIYTFAGSLPDTHFQISFNQMKDSIHLSEALLESIHQIYETISIVDRKTYYAIADQCSKKPAMSENNGKLSDLRAMTINYIISQPTGIDKAMAYAKAHPRLAALIDSANVNVRNAWYALYVSELYRDKPHVLLADVISVMEGNALPNENPMLVYLKKECEAQKGLETLTRFISLVTDTLSDPDNLSQVQKLNHFLASPLPAELNDLTQSIRTLLSIPSFTRVLLENKEVKEEEGKEEEVEELKEEENGKEEKRIFSNIKVDATYPFIKQLPHLKINKKTNPQDNENRSKLLLTIAVDDLFDLDGNVRGDIQNSLSGLDLNDNHTKKQLIISYLCDVIFTNREDGEAELYIEYIQDLLKTQEINAAFVKHMNDDLLTLIAAPDRTRDFQESVHSHLLLKSIGDLTVLTQNTDHPELLRQQGKAILDEVNVLLEKAQPQDRVKVIQGIRSAIEVIRKPTRENIDACYAIAETLSKRSITHQLSGLLIALAGAAVMLMIPVVTVATMGGIASKETYQAGREIIRKGLQRAGYIGFAGNDAFFKKPLHKRVRSLAKEAEKKSKNEQPVASKKTGSQSY